MGFDGLLWLHAGCFIAPLTFQLYWHSFDIGDPNSEYKAPFANIYRGMAIIGTQVGLRVTTDTFKGM